MADLYRDFVFTRCTTPVASTDLNVSVEDVSLFPSNNVLARGEFYVAFESSLSYPHTFEICRVVSVNTATKTLTLLRAQGGSTAQAHPIVTYIKGTLTADMVRRARQGFQGATAPSPDLDVFVVGDRYFNTTENRYYAFTGKAGWFVDTFTRAASALTLGNTETVTTNVFNAAPQVPYNLPYVGTWQPVTGVWGVNASGQAYYVSGAVSNTAVATLNVGGIDVDFSFDMFASTTAGSDYGLVFRSNTDFTYGYYLQCAGTTATLYRMNNGTFGTTSQTTTYTTNTAHTWRVTAIGNAITVYRDGTSVISYTEAVNAMLATTGNVGASLGMRIGTASGISDTSLYWDNFKATTPGNTAPNSPTPQGWAPTSAITGSTTDPTTFTQAQLANIEGNLLNVVQQLDDAIQADANVESTVLKHDIDIAAIYATMDDWLSVIQDHETRIASQANTDVVVATQVDELAATLVSSTSQYAIGAPSITGTLGQIYVDGTSKRIWSHDGTNWQVLTYSGPGATISPVSFVGSTTNGSSASYTLALPSGSAVGDTALLFWSYYVDSDRGTPTGFTRLTYNNIVPYYWGGGISAYKILTASDISTGSVSVPSYDQGNGVLRVYRNCSTPVATSNVSAPGNNGLVTAPAATSVNPNSTVVSFFWVEAPGAVVNSPTGVTSNISSRQQGSPTNAIYSGDTTFTGTAPTRTFLAGSPQGGSPATGSISVVLSPVGGVVPSPFGLTTSVVANYSAGSGEVVLVNAASGAATVALPTPTANTTITVKKTDAGTNAVTVSSAASIDGAGTFVLRNQYDAVSMIADGTTWWVF